MWRLGTLFDNARKLGLWVLTGLAIVMIWGLAEAFLQKSSAMKAKSEKLTQPETHPDEHYSTGQDQILSSTPDDFLKTSKGIRLVQQALRNAGFDPGRIDGKIGPRTKKAIINFKKARRMPATSVIDSEMLAALEPYF